MEITQECYNKAVAVRPPTSNWDLYPTGQLVDSLQQQKKKKKRKPVFIKRKWNHVVFSRATILSFHPVEGYNRSWDLCTTGQLVDCLQQKQQKKKKKKKKTGFH